MRTILLAGVALAISACSGGGNKSNNAAANGTTTDNMMLNQAVPLDQNLSMDPMANGMTNGMANGATGTSTQNMLEKDAKTNDPDTNLANGI